MELRYYARQLPSSLEYLKIHPIADLHYGNPFCDEDRFRRKIIEIKNDPNSYIILVGDLCEAVLKASKGDVYSQEVNPQKQRDWVIIQLEAIKDKILGMTSGNHEDRVYKETGIDISLDIARALGCPYDPDGIFLKVSFGGGNSNHPEKPFTYWVYSTHGYGGARTKSAKAVKVERLATQIDADVYIMGHDHVVNSSPDVYLVPDARTAEDKETGFMVGKVTAHRKELVKASAYLKWGGYSRKLGFPPTDLVSPTIFLAGNIKPWDSERNSKPRVRVLV